MFYKRSKDYEETGMLTVLDEGEYNTEMDKIERIAKEKIDVILNKKHTDSMDFILEQTEHCVTINMMKSSSKTIDTFKNRVKIFLMNIL